MAESALTPEVAGERATSRRGRSSASSCPSTTRPDDRRQRRGRSASASSAGLGERDRVDRRLGRLDRRERGARCSRTSPRARVIHYDRNLGKGYAVKTGALAARGRYISYVDADLDLDPASIPDVPRSSPSDESLDFVIGSKRHPESHRPLPAVAPSRELALPAARAPPVPARRTRHAGRPQGLPARGRRGGPAAPARQAVRLRSRVPRGRARTRLRRIREQPVTLRVPLHRLRCALVAVLLALVDTAAIFYRLRILRYYQRKRPLLPAYARTHGLPPRVTLVSPASRPTRSTTPSSRRSWHRRRDARARAREVLPSSAEGEIVAFLEPGATSGARTGSRARCRSSPTPRSPRSSRPA